jgi:hypothetical protein
LSQIILDVSSAASTLSVGAFYSEVCAAHLVDTPISKSLPPHNILVDRREVKKRTEAGVFPGETNHHPHPPPLTPEEQPASLVSP